MNNKPKPIKIRSLSMKVSHRRDSSKLNKNKLPIIKKNKEIEENNNKNKREKDETQKNKVTFDEIKNKQFESKKPEKKLEKEEISRAKLEKISKKENIDFTNKCSNHIKIDTTIKPKGQEKKVKKEKTIKSIKPEKATKIDQIYKLADQTCKPEKPENAEKLDKNSRKEIIETNLCPHQKKDLNQVKPEKDIWRIGCFRGTSDSRKEQRRTLTGERNSDNSDCNTSKIERKCHCHEKKEEEEKIKKKEAILPLFNLKPPKIKNTSFINDTGFQKEVMQSYFGDLKVKKEEVGNEEVYKDFEFKKNKVDKIVDHIDGILNRVSKVSFF